MDCRGRKREDAAEQLPADKRACSSSGLRAGPSSSHSPTVHPIASSSTPTTNAVTGGDVESSSGRSERDSVSVDGSCDSDDGGVDDDDEDDEPGEGFRGDRVEFSKGKIKKILSGLEDEADPGAQLSALTELNETLSLCMEDSLMCLSMETLVPLLVKLAGQEDKPDIMLMAIRSLTYLCDLMPRLSGVLVRHGALPVLCARLMAIQYLDVAEQCLQALEKISRNQPAPCLQAGTIVAALTYIDFFTTSVQRVALSTVANVCKKLPSDCSSLVKESIPTLCNLLQYEDRKLVETAAICLIRITEGFSGSSEMLDELCKHGVVHKSASLIASDSRMTLSQTTYIGLIGLLTRLASGSVIAVRTLFELNISSILRDILITCGISNSTTFSLVSHEQSNQVHEVLKLLNQLLPPVAKENKDIKLTMDKEKILVDEPKLLHQFASDILPISIQVVNSGANLAVCYGCVSIITNIVYFSTPDMLLDLLKDTNISSFLSGILTRKDHHVLFSALKTAEILLQRHRDVFLSSFIKEGVVCAIGALLVPENSVVRNSCQPVHLQPSTDSHSQMSMKDVKRCLCYAFDACPSSSSSEAEDCRLGNEAVLNLATSLYTIYLTSASTDFEMGLTEALQKLKSLSALLIDNVDKLSKNDYSAENEECLSQILEEIVMELICGEPLSTFEFIESGIVRSLAYYLSNGVHLQGNVDNQRITDHFHVVMKRFEKFASISLSKSAHHWENMPLTLLIRKLQSALSSFDPFPVILSGTSKPRNVYANIPVGRSTTVPCLKVCFMVAEGETILSDYSANTVTVEPSSSLDAIEGFLWPKVSTNRTEQHSESAGKCLNETGEDINVSHIKGNKEPQDNSTKITGKLQNLSSSLLEGITKQEIRQLPEAGGTMRAGVPVTENPSSPASTDKGHNVGRQWSASHHNGNAPPKLTFYFEGKQLDRSLTLYQEILQQQVNAQPDMIVGPKFWNEVYKVTYKRAEQKARDLEVSSSGSLSLNAWGKAGISWPKPSFFSSELVAELPCKLEKSNPSYDILFMLKILEGLNRFSFHLMSYEKSKAFGERRIVDFDDLMVISPLIPQTEFQSSKLTEKLEQQMRDPLALSTGSMPSWCCQLMAACPFLFSFEARWKYLRMTAFNSSQVQQSSMPQLNSNIDHSSSGQRSHTQTYSRKRFRVDRSHVLESAAKMMALHARNNAALEVEYFEEIGTGVGPTMEFYTLASREFQKVGLGMWRGDDRSSISPLREGTNTSVDDSKYVVAPLGLFPRPWSAATSSFNEIQFSKVTEKFVLLGQVVAKALQDGRILDLPFSGAFYKLILGQELDIYDIHSFDPELGKTLLEFQALVDRKRFLESTMVDITQANSVLHFRGTDVEDLCLDFTLPGYSDYLLASGSSSKMVNIDNLEEYVSLTVDATVRSGISRQLDAFKSGFNQVFPLKALHIFTVGELERLLCGEQDTLSFDDLLDHIKFDHGYTSSSPPVTSLLETIQELECNQQRAFLQFVTGAPRLPPGGLAALSPKLTIVRKHCSDCVDMALPSVMTCANYLKLPPYSSKERTKERLLYAITEGQGSFHLS